MRAAAGGFLTGSLVLIVLYALTQRGAAGAVEAGGGAFGSGLRRVLSADVAGVPDRSGGAGASIGSKVGAGVKKEMQRGGG